MDELYKTDNNAFMKSLREGTLYGGLDNSIGNDTVDNVGWGTGTNAFGGMTPDIQTNVNTTPGGMDFSKMLSGGLGGLGSLFSAEKGGTSVMGGLAPWVQMGLGVLADNKNDPSRANNEVIQRQQIASNNYNSDKLKRNDIALGRAFGTA